MSSSNQPPRDFVTVISGVPRSGTSMMARMLAAGGLSILTDGARAADPDNPHGYFEWEPVKSLEQSSAWVADAVGKGVKVIYYSLRALPTGYQYRVLFMRRNLGEVLQSQTKMLKRRGVTGPTPDDATMKRLFEGELRDIDEWLASQPAFTVLNVDYASVLNDPAAEARRANAFLGGALDETAMTAMVDPQLHRCRVVEP